MARNKTADVLDKGDLPLRDVTPADFTFEEVVLVMVYTKTDLIASLKRSRIQYYLQNLQASGLKIDSIQSVTNKNVVFVIISALQDVLYKYAPTLGIPLHSENPFFREKARKRGQKPKRFLAIESDESVELKNLNESLGQMKMREMTQAERVQIMYQMLKYAKYGYAEDDVGISRLLGQGTIQTIYPTHDKTTEDTDNNFLTDKMLLMNMWASWKCFFKRQPTFLIQKYFGAEVGFYFAYLNYFAKMLIPASVLGILTFSFGVISMFTSNNFKSDEVCSSQIIMCPTCLGNCHYTSLNYSCAASNFNYMVDNQMTVVYGILISIWSTISYELWKREQSSLAYQWNVSSAHVNLSVRPQYEISATLRKISPVTGEWEPYQDTALKIFHTGVSVLTMAALCVLSICVIVGVTIYYSRAIATFAFLHYNPSDEVQALVSRMTASFISVLLMVIFDYAYRHIALWLVNLENPRTEQEFDNSYILKVYFLTCINSFGVAVYISFFKGKINDNPGDYAMRYFHTDHCDPTGCAEDLCMHIFIVLMVKCLAKDLISYGMFRFRTFWREYKIKKLSSSEVPLYEEQYYMNKPTKFFLVNEYKEIAMQYGYIIFFSSAQPLAPLIVLVHTLIGIRLVAIRIMKNYRRPLPISTSGIGAWMQVFMATTQLGVVTNALVIGWTMSFVPTVIYTYKDTTVPYYENRFATFNTSDYPDSILEKLQNIQTHPPTCRYTALRYPPHHPHKYEYCGSFWHEVSWIMAFIIIFEHVVLAITSIIAYNIPDIPEVIRQLMEYENLKMVKENYQKIGENVSDDARKKK